MALHLYVIVMLSSGVGGFIGFARAQWRGLWIGVALGCFGAFGWVATYSLAKHAGTKSS